MGLDVIKQQGDYSIIDSQLSGGSGAVRLHHPAGTFALTPASRMALHAVSQHRHLLRGRGIDWGSGIGSLAILAATMERVAQVVGLEISQANVRVAQQNAVQNGVSEKVRFLLSDSYTPLAEADRQFLQTFAGQTQFIVSNPPTSEGDDGFGFRRQVLRDGLDFLQDDGVVFLSISSQYGQARIARLTQDAPGYRYGGVLVSSGWQPFDLQRPDLLLCLQQYVQQEELGGLHYVFLEQEGASVGEDFMDARAAWARYGQSGQSPLMKWGVHLFHKL